MQTLTKGLVLEFDVTIERITPFTKWNIFTDREETRFCVSMSQIGRPDTEPWIITFTRGKFPDYVEVGDRVRVRCKYRNHQMYRGLPQVVVTHCKLI